MLEELCREYYNRRQIYGTVEGEVKEDEEAD